MESAGHVNRYACNRCGKEELVVLMCHGTTPFLKSCPGCSKDGDTVLANSTFYKLTPPRFSVAVQSLAYRPKELPEDEATRQHVLQGGLLFSSLSEPLPAMAPDDYDERKGAWEQYIQEVYGVEAE